MIRNFKFLIIACVLTFLSACGGGGTKLVLLLLVLQKVFGLAQLRMVQASH
jgi:hypothetical protein